MLNHTAHISQSTGSYSELRIRKSPEPAGFRCDGREAPCQLHHSVSNLDRAAMLLDIKTFVTRCEHDPKEGSRVADGAGTFLQYVRQEKSTDIGYDSHYVS
jgi:hypothetical protein